jgi:hypothetical protein
MFLQCNGCRTRAGAVYVETLGISTLHDPTRQVDNMPKELLDVITVLAR